MESREYVAGVVVLYNPDKDFFQRNIISYINFVDVLYIINNSVTRGELIDGVLSEYSNIEYIENKTNLGIAKALNIGALKALEFGYKWLLTMDQDSWFEKKDITRLVRSLQFIETSKIAIISPIHNEDEKRENEFSYSEEYVVMTSGNLLNLKLFEKIGIFKEEFFIDMVDLEYCLRAKKQGFSIIKINNVFLHHNLGNIIKVKILPYRRPLILTNHNSLRRYYIIRNFLYLRKEYNKIYERWFYRQTYSIITMMVKILFFEQDKMVKFKMMWRGYKDYKAGKSGMFERK